MAGVRVRGFLWVGGGIAEIRDAPQICRHALGQQLVWVHTKGWQCQVGHVGPGLGFLWVMSSWPEKIASPWTIACCSAPSPTCLCQGVAWGLTGALTSTHPPWCGQCSGSAPPPLPTPNRHLSPQTGSTLTDHNSVIRYRLTILSTVLESSRQELSFARFRLRNRLFGGKLCPFVCGDPRGLRPPPSSGPWRAQGGPHGIDQTHAAYQWKALGIRVAKMALVASGTSRSTGRGAWEPL